MARPEEVAVAVSIAVRACLDAWAQNLEEVPECAAALALVLLSESPELAAERARRASERLGDGFRRALERARALLGASRFRLGEVELVV